MPPVPLTSFQESLWDDLWADGYIEGVDGLLSEQPAADTAHVIHRLEWDSSVPTMGGEAAAGTLTGVQVWSMDWVEEPTASLSVALGGGASWDGDVTVEVFGFSGQISSGGSYEPYVFGMAWELSIVENAASGGGVFQFTVWAPLGRGLTAASAAEAAEDYASEILPPPQPVTTDSDSCASIFFLKRDTAYNDYQIDMGNCGGGGLGGAAGGAGIGAAIGSPAGIFGAGIGAAIFGTIGYAIDKVAGHSACVDAAKDSYNKTYVRDYNCYLQCIIAGEWICQ